MKVNLESTTKIINIDGIPVRIWEGTSESGIKIHALITRVVLDKNENSEEFEKELKECVSPSAEIEAYPLHLIL